MFECYENWITSENGRLHEPDSGEATSDAASCVQRCSRNGSQPGHYSSALYTLFHAWITRYSACRLVQLLPLFTSLSAEMENVGNSLKCLDTKLATAPRRVPLAANAICDARVASRIACAFGACCRQLKLKPCFLLSVNNHGLRNVQGLAEFRSSNESAELASTSF